MATILFVDDDEMERAFAREILEPRGHRVLYAGDGESALKVYGTEPVDVVVTDLAMPKLNGLRLIQELRGLDRQAKVIAASGINADQLDMAEDFGAVAVLQKPWDPREFLEMLDDVLDGNPAKNAASDEVWSQLTSGTQLDEEGRLITPDAGAEKEEAEPEEIPGGDPEERQYGDFHIEDVELEDPMKDG